MVEAMVATAVMGIGFLGVYTIVSSSNKLMSYSIQKQKTQMIANQILDVIETDITNINSYDMDLGTCTTPAGGETNQYVLRGYEWCVRLAAELGAAKANDDRTITVTTLADGMKVVTVLLEGSSEKVQIIMKRAFTE